MSYATLLMNMHPGSKLRVPKLWVLGPNSHHCSVTNLTNCLSCGLQVKALLNTYQYSLIDQAGMSQILRAQVIHRVHSHSTTAQRDPSVENVTIENVIMLQLKM